MASQEGFSARSIANYFIDKSIDDKDEVTQMKLQKLTYIAHGWCLALLNRPLIRDSVQAWEYGPVYPGLYHELKEFGRRPIQQQIQDWVIDSESDTFALQPASIHMESDNEEDKHRISALLEKVWEVYKPFSALELSAMTHERGTPWDFIVNRFPGIRQKHMPIPNEIIKKHYEEMARGGDG